VQSLLDGSYRTVVPYISRRTATAMGIGRRRGLLPSPESRPISVTCNAIRTSEAAPDRMTTAAAQLEHVTCNDPSFWDSDGRTLWT
jgi:hypothetical protein